ncbi:carbohydrate ABC transporter permease [Limobrevibacterium gyesilva]|uniref:Sugar ABC transporter permease n=1 Tax=Limobrevibacterium gyesilva TaxID=2991712 RepID=A0AA41YYS2_9PROT|nr:sugar ABC transporter permease [Limobrevibacterium gyesilva]MCW3477717.1 sugar ABC transporter permease [Limobrevibacterium gyesilva]
MPWLLVLPSLVLAFAVIGYPLYEIMRLSVADVSRFGQVRGFVGWGNFSRMLADPVFVAALVRTLEWTVAVVGGTVLISMPVALVLQQDFWGRGLARTIVMLPWSVSLSMAAIVWLWSFDGNHGMVNTTLQSLGLLSGPVQWMALPQTAFPVEIAVGILVSIPFTVTIFLGGLSSIPGDIYEAAAIDGATRTQSFRLLTLPLMRGFLNIAIVLNVIYVFNSFPIIWVMTQGGPDNSTHILVTYLYELSFRLGRPGMAAAVSLAMLVIVFAFTMVYVRMQSREAA